MIERSAYKSIFLGLGLAGPFVAQAAASPQTLTGLVDLLVGIIRLAIPVLIALALFLVLWGIVRFMVALSTGNEEQIKSGKSLMVWGVIALFVMVSVWGILNILTGTFGWPLGIPQLPEGGSPNSGGGSVI